STATGAGASSYADTTCQEKSGRAPPDSRAALLAVLFIGDEVNELGGAGALAPGGRSGVGGRGEVELGPGPADVARGGVVGDCGRLGGGEGAEPDVHALDGVADLGGPLAPRAAPDALVLRRLAAPARRRRGQQLLLPPQLPGRGAGGGSVEPERLALHLVGVPVELPERGLEVVGPLLLGRGPEVARRDAARRLARYELGEDRTTAHLCLLAFSLALPACWLLKMKRVSNHLPDAIALVFGLE
ncbi:hypothetical protein PVAP13_9KG432323, partial [Panicum virgatum]